MENDTRQVRTIRYGDTPVQVGDLYLPDAPCPAIVCLVHGGFWRMPYARDQWSCVAHDLVGRGYAVWNIGYRRSGAPDGDWPAALHDVAAAVESLADIADAGVSLDLDRVVLVGHSAGGQLALWAGARSRPEGFPQRDRIHPFAVAGLAPAADLVGIHALGCGGNAVSEWIGGPPELMARRYETSSPLALLPLGLAQLIIHGTLDEALPATISSAYVDRARLLGDCIEHHALEVGHMDFLDASSQAHAVLCDWLVRMFAQPTAARNAYVQGGR